MSTYTIYNTEIKDLNRVCQLWEDAIHFQKSKGFPEYKWDDREKQKQSILKKDHYKLMLRDEIIGVFNLQTSDKIVWREMDKNDAIYLHGVLVDSKYKGQKVFQNVMDLLVSYTQKQNRRFIRLDTWANNPSLINYYKKFGFDVVEEFQTPQSPKVPLNCRGNKVVLMEYDITLK